MTVDNDLLAASDASLVIAVARSRSDALEEIYRRHGGTVLGLAQRILQNRPAAEEIVQEVFVRLWRAPERFDFERGSLRSFLCAQAHSRCVDVIRAESARRRRQERDAVSRTPERHDVADTVADLLVAEQLRAVVESLPEKEKRVIELAYFQGLTYREVAEYLDEPEGTVKSRIRNGLKTMHAQLMRSGLTLGELSS